MGGVSFQGPTYLFFRPSKRPDSVGVNRSARIDTQGEVCVCVCSILTILTIMALTFELESIGQKVGDYKSAKMIRISLVQVPCPPEEKKKKSFE